MAIQALLQSISGPIPGYQSPSFLKLPEPPQDPRLSGGGPLMMPPISDMPSGGMPAEFAENPEIMRLIQQAFGQQRQAIATPMPEKPKLNDTQLGIGAILSFLTNALGDKEQTFMKGALSTIQGQIEDKHKEQVQKLEQKKQEQLLQAEQAMQQAQQLRQQDAIKREIVLNRQKMMQDQQQFNREDDTKRYLGELGAQGRETADKTKQLIEARKSFGTDPTIEGRQRARQTIYDLTGVDPGDPAKVLPKDALTGRKLDQGDRKLDQSMKMNARHMAKIDAEINRMGKLNGLTDEQIANVKKKTSIIDAESQAKVADIWSRVSKRSFDKEHWGMLKPSEANKVLDAHIGDLDKLIKIHESDMKAAQKEGNADRYVELHNALIPLKAEREEAAKMKMAPASPATGAAFRKNPKTGAWEEVPNPTGGGGPKPYKEIEAFAEQMGFKHSGGGARSGHNVGSPHYRDIAVDIRTRDKTPAEIESFIQAAKSRGYHVRDERTRPAGQAVWTGPHLHLEIRK